MRVTITITQKSFVAGMDSKASSHSSHPHPPAGSSPLASLADRSVSKHLLDRLLEGYDLDKWPTFFTAGPNTTAEPTLSHISVDIMFISSINVEAMDLTVDMYLNQMWTDKRLRFDDTLSKSRLHLKTVEQMRRIWAPDTYIVNAKQANFHHVTTENRVVYIAPSGEVFYSARITAKVACDMKFHSFPMDTQECYLHLASYAYTVEVLQMFWLKERPVSYKKDMDLNQFHLTNVTTIHCRDPFPDGEYPCLKIFFKFERRVAHHLIQTFLPTVLIVTISWVSFYIQAEAVPARISLGITTLLTMITLNSGTKQGLPPVSYVKAIDVWMGVCTFFVFSAIWEYVVVCMLSRRPIKCAKHDLARLQNYAAGAGKERKDTLLPGDKSPLVIPNTYAHDTPAGSLPPPATYPAQPHSPAQSPTSVVDTAAVLNAINQAEYHALTNRRATRSSTSFLRSSAPPVANHVTVGNKTTNATQTTWPTRFPAPVYETEMMQLVWQPRNSGQLPIPNSSSRNSFGVTATPAPTGAGLLEIDPGDIDYAGVTPDSEYLPRASRLESVAPRKKRRLKPKCVSCFAQAKSASERSKRVDISARVIYPAMFLFFNFFYWPYYLYLSNTESIMPDNDRVVV
ncbi:gamma-aminobutyric acid receptor subunit alpha-5-like isoform X2 [Paramacrobiotus metropolitanus]|uniref:gamma-aminobutyric acid receptor subunit alpha-5-like isoform X2 n=1 Tax=Paramacrobiotus metropolitanus TaxID=2943436 RepID=UPI0024462925|nr:gamma-aminobutyric acid receptor subunit alpha-5-like isoform X2 [Paramacrobiotus metropolitanus]